LTPGGCVVDDAGVEAKEDNKGVLYLVATPIGNTEDLSPRAKRVLSEVSLIAAEDTRHTRQLLSSCGIQNELISYREQNHAKVADRLLEHCARGQDVALVSDAGTPGISDPGQRLVAEAIERGIPVIPIPGPVAAMTALCASGLPTDRFLFVGFLPRKSGSLRKLFEELCVESATLIFYESPRRVGETLKIMAEVFGARKAVLARELTKVHETLDRGSLPELAERYREGTLGEVTLLVEGAMPGPRSAPKELSEIIRALRSGKSLRTSEIASLLAPLCGLDRKAVYSLVVDKEKSNL
jgi:16S rRNA (cytidine1402-2'-O)-methyltransferase